MPEIESNLDAPTGCACGMPQRLGLCKPALDPIGTMFHAAMHSIMFVMLEHERTAHGIPNTDVWVDLFGPDLALFEWVQEQPDLARVAEAIHERVHHDQEHAA